MSAPPLLSWNGRHRRTRVTFLAAANAGDCGHLLFYSLLCGQMVLFSTCDSRLDGQSTKMLAVLALALLSSAMGELHARKRRAVHAAAATATAAGPAAHHE